MAKMAERLHALAPQIRELCSLCGVAGVSIGVVHHGNVIYKDNFGHRDIEMQTPPDSDTAYYIGSMTKGFTAEAVAILVDEGKLAWNTPVKDILPEFRSRDPTIDAEATMVDFLSHRTGLERSDALWAQCNDNILLSKAQEFPTINSLRPVTPFRSTYRYNNWGFDIAGRVVEKLSGLSYGQFLREKIFKPLGMNTTFTKRDCDGYDNVAKAYMARRDASLVNVVRPKVEDGSLIGPAGGIQSTVNDLLIYYTTLMKSAEHQFSTQTTSTPDSPLKQLPALLSTRISTATTLREQSYALGWARSQLPGSLRDTSRNEPLIQPFPIIGDPSQPRLAIYHHGMLVGYNSGVYLFPETQTGVVLLSNSVAVNDGPDWIAHMIIQTLFNDSEKLDYFGLARQTVANQLSLHDGVAAEVQKQVDSSKPPRELDIYTGTYLNSLETFSITITNEEEGLVMNFQGFEVETYQLKHIRGDEFSWHMPFDEQVTKARVPVAYVDYWKINFEFAKGVQKAQKLFWVIERDLPEGAAFNRKQPLTNHHNEL